MDELINDLITLVKTKPTQYSTQIKYNLTPKLLLNKYEQLEINKQLHKVKNFPIKSQMEYLISLRCIINNKRIIKPARTSQCLHIECMELINLFKYVLKFGKCPLCENNDEKLKINNNIIRVDSIYIDEYLYKIIQEINNKELDFEYIIVNKNTNKWRIYDPYFSNYLIEIENENYDEDIDEHLNELKEINDYINIEENQIEIEKILNLLK